MNREILRLAIPNILSNISLPLMSMVDTALMGHLSTLHLGAVGIATMIFNFVYWNFGFLRMGVTGMIAQEFGRDDQRAMIITGIKAIILALLISMVIWLFQNLIFTGSVFLLDISPTHLPLVSRYYDIRIWSAPATLVIYTLMGWVLGRQDSWSAMQVTIIANLVNIVLSYLLTYQLSYGIKGVALATVFAEYLTVLLLILAIHFRHIKLFTITNLHWKGISSWLEYKIFFYINSNLFIRTLALTSTFMAIYRISMEAGAIIMAANVIILQLLSWMSYGLDGFAFAAESIVGKYVGKREKLNIDKSINYIFRWAIGFGITASLVLLLWGQNIYGLYTNEVPVLDHLFTHNWILVILPLIALWSYIWDGIFIGLVESKWMRDSMLIAVLCFALSYYLLEPHYTFALWMSFMLFLGIRGLGLYVLWKVAVRPRLFA